MVLLREVHCYTYQDRGALVDSVTEATPRSGGLILHQASISPCSFLFEVETSLHSIVELYVELIAVGLEFTQSGQSAMAELCRCGHYTAATDDPHLIELELHVSLLQGVSLQVLLENSSPLA